MHTGGLESGFRRTSKVYVYLLKSHWVLLKSYSTCLSDTELCSSHTLTYSDLLYPTLLELTPLNSSLSKEEKTRKTQKRNESEKFEDDTNRRAKSKQKGKEQTKGKRERKGKGKHGGEDCTAKYCKTLQNTAKHNTTPLFSVYLCLTCTIEERRLLLPFVFSSTIDSILIFLY
ncbi:hypothetical protein BDV97DRAFT_106185 [Delphinella strobiligena]|nr:hypothetical protein BDV97DRAFT_106185 [Delphinella strobiligena]